MNTTPHPTLRPLRALLAAALLLAAQAGQAHTGLTVLNPADGGPPVTVVYPSDAPPRPERVGWLVQPLARDGEPVPGNGRLVVLSHGSGGNPWVHLDLARRLSDAGFVVAFPQHQGDHQGDPSRPGPDSWTRRPAEVSRAIDAVLADPRWQRLAGTPIGLWGMSAGGHTALSLAGGRWSPARFARHCDEHLDEDFAFCVGLATRLTGSPLDGLRRLLARQVIGHRFGADERLREDRDPRLAAIVAEVPAAADFEPASLARPAVPLGLVNALQDRWLAPRFHGLRVLQGCTGCEDLATVPQGGHGMGLSPQPPLADPLLIELLGDPPGFDRATEVPAVQARVVAFFRRHLAPD